MGRLTEAAAAYERAVALAPTMSKALENLGRLVEHQGPRQGPREPLAPRRAARPAAIAARLGAQGKEGESEVEQGQGQGEETTGHAECTGPRSGEGAENVQGASQGARDEERLLLRRGAKDAVAD